MNGFYYAFPYLLYVVYCLMICRIQARGKVSINKVRQYTFWGFFLFFSLRGYVYSDCFEYYTIYESSKPFPNFEMQSISIVNYSIEPLFQLLAKSVKIFTDEYIAFQTVNSLIDFWLLDICLRRTPSKYAFTFLIFVIFYGIFIEINLLRNVKSILLFSISTKYIVERNFKYYFFINLVGFLFHFSSIFVLPIYWIGNLKFPKILLWIILVVGIIIPLFNLRIVSSLLDLSFLSGMRYSVYLDSVSVGKFGIRSIERIVLFIIALKLYKRCDKEMMLYCNLYFIFYFLFQFFYDMEIIIDRLAKCYTLSIWFILPYYFNSLKVKTKKIAYMILVLYGFAVIYVGNSDATARYTNVLFNEIDYNKAQSKYQDNLFYYKLK